MNKLNLQSPELSRRVFTWPNLISFGRIVLIPVFIHFILIARFDLALVTFAVAGISDGLDGYLARRLNQRTVLGQMIDPIGDKLLMLSSYLVLASSGSNFTPIPLWLTVGVIGRDAGIVCVATLIYWYTGFRDFKPAWPGKVSTVIQVCFIVFFLLAQLWLPARQFILTASVITGATTLFSAGYYVFFVKAELRAYHKRRVAVYTMSQESQSPEEISSTGSPQQKTKAPVQPITTR